MPPVSNFQVMEASEHRLRLVWVPVSGSSGYRLVWRPAEGECAQALCLHANPWPLTSVSPPGGPQRSQQLPATANSYDLGGLEPGRRYHISITSMVGSRESAPVTITTATGKGCVVLQGGWVEDGDECGSGMGTAP